MKSHRLSFVWSPTNRWRKLLIVFKKSHYNPSHHNRRYATHPQAAGQTFLVSDGEDVSTPKLIRQVASALDRPARLIPFPPALMRLAGKLMDNFGFWILNFKLFKSKKTIHHTEFKIKIVFPDFPVQ